MSKNRMMYSISFFEKERGLWLPPQAPVFSLPAPFSHSDLTQYQLLNRWIEIYRVIKIKFKQQRNLTAFDFFCKRALKTEVD